MEHHLYMVCTNDEFELPVMVSDTMKDVVAFMGMTLGSCYSYVSKGIVTAGKKRFRLEKIRYTDEEWKEIAI